MTQKNEKETPAKQPGGGTYMERIRRCADLLLQYNACPDGETELRDDILTRLLGARGTRLRIKSPFCANFGDNIRLGENCFINMNCTFLDDAVITIGDYAMLAPDVKIYTAFHPLSAGERWSEKRLIDGFEYPITYTAPVTIGDRAWIGGGVIIMPGVTIGCGSVVGAGSVVTKDIPAGVIACGHPCRVVREIPEFHKY